MNELLPMITERDGKPVTTSRAVAEQFGKQHKNVIQSIDGLRATLDETEDGREFTRAFVADFIGGVHSNPNSLQADTKPCRA